MPHSRRHQFESRFKIMPKQSNVRVSARKTLRAARAFSRRQLLGRGASALALAGAASIGPWPVRDAFSSSGECRVFIWTDYFPKEFVDKFEAKTGIKLKITNFGSNEQLLNKIKATRGRGYDLIAPTMMRADQWRDLDLLKPWNPHKLPLDNIEPRFLQASERDWTWTLGLYHLPHLWGTEAIAYRVDQIDTTYGKLSLGDLWRDDVKGAVTGRPHSVMAGIGRYLASIGKLPPFEEAYTDADTMRSIWSEITAFAIKRKPWFRSLWNDAESLRDAFLRNGARIGQTWDGPMIELKKAGEPINYMAPLEGAFAWLDGFALPSGAENIDHVYELLKACYEPENAALQASLSGYNATVKGVGKYLPEKSKKAFDEAYPGDALDRLWWWPTEPQWYADQRAAYRDQFVAA